MPSFRKQFIAANGLQIGDNLIVANVESGHIGIGTSFPSRTIDVIA